MLEGLVLGLLGLSLALFLLRRGRGEVRGGERALGFGIGFSAFLSAWILTELLGMLAPPAWAEASDGVHFSVLLGFAIWLNVRWGWALRHAREGS
ncbi:MAG: hypothetical protein ACE5LS_02015 [Thermoplasmata archaeon]